jgi:hypothetical protein
MNHPRVGDITEQEFGVVALDFQFRRATGWTCSTSNAKRGRRNSRRTSSEPEASGWRKFKVLYTDSVEGSPDHPHLRENLVSIK